MTKRRRVFYRRRKGGAEEVGGDGQDSFLDVVSNLVGILIILVMIAGARVRDVAVASADSTKEKESQVVSEKDVDDVGLGSDATNERLEYVAVARALDELRVDVEKERADAEETSAQTLLVEQRANGAEEEYKRLLETTAALDGALEVESRKRSDSDKIAFDLKSEIFEKEKKIDDLRRENDALATVRPNTTVLENVPTPISKRVDDGREGFFCLKNGRISHVPLNMFQERVRLYFKNYRGDMAQREIEEKVGPIENYYFHYFVDFDVQRDSEGIRYSFLFRYGECLPENDEVGEPIDEALANQNSLFQRSLGKYIRADTTITTFVYPDSFVYLRDVKKFLISNGWQIAIRPLPDGAPIAVSPEGTASSTY